MRTAVIQTGRQLTRFSPTPTDNSVWTFIRVSQRDGSYQKENLNQQNEAEENSSDGFRMIYCENQLLPSRVSTELQMLNKCFTDFSPSCIRPAFLAPCKHSVYVERRGRMRSLLLETNIWKEKATQRGECEQIHCSVYSLKRQYQPTNAYKRFLFQNPSLRGARISQFDIICFQSEQ